MRGNRRTLAARIALAGMTISAVLGTSMPAANAGLLDDLLDTTEDLVTTVVDGVVVDGVVNPLVDTVDGVLGIVTQPGWDEGATTAPTPLGDVTAAVGADQLWAKGVDGSGIDIALIDSGVVPVAGLAGAGKVVDGPDLSFESQSDELRHLDTYGHGTHMASVAAANDGPYRGVAPGSRIVNLKVAARDGAVDVSQVIAAIDWVVQHRNEDGLNIRVLNLSFGTDSVQPYERDPLAKAVESAWHNGIVVVVAAGNEGTAREALVNPATDPYVIAVGAADLRGTVAPGDDTIAPFSSRGTRSRSVDVVAPGVSLLGLRTPGSHIDDSYPGAVVDGRYLRGSGTSQAAAVTSGAVALLLDARPSLSPDAVKALLRSTADRIDADGRAQGAGRIDVAAASKALVPLFNKQSHTRSTGTGSLEAARGTSHVGDDGVELRGEVDVLGSAWKGSVWAPLSAKGAAWNGGTWNGAAWTGDCFCATSLTGHSWAGRSWAGGSWSGRSWAGRSWAGRSWAGGSWSGGSWSGGSWTGGSWSGRSWASS